MSEAARARACLGLPGGGGVIAWSLGLGSRVGGGLKVVCLCVALHGQEHGDTLFTQKRAWWCPLHRVFARCSLQIALTHLRIGPHSA